ncbi:MAG: metal-dependent hydrolase of the beta-lactamase superfamily III [halophilic archaeon J07HX5]|nr:MAG: metal-dependent hydrolase of the beta-lactamase superfamily III [halophilic archaeon J07HX5]
MRITAVGTSGGVPTAQYGTSCVYLNVFGEKLLFDCGEGSQQRLMRYSSSPNVDAVFISHCYADHTLGVPGLVQSLEMNERERPLDIYVPEHRTQRATDLIEGAYEWPSYRIEIHGYNSDEPARRTGDYSVRPFSTPYTEHSHGFCLQETDTREFLVERARALGIDPGPKYGKLQAGQSVTADDGETVAPEDVLSEPTPGRKIVYTGDTRPTAAVVDAASNASLFIYSAMFADEQSERARSTGHSTAAEAGAVASDAGAERLWLTHFSPRHEDDEQRLVAQAEQPFDGEVVAARDGESLEL